MTCPVCGAITSPHQHPRFDWLFHVCPWCELIFKDPKHLPSESESLKQYGFHQNDCSNQGYVDYLLDFIHQSVMPFIQSGFVLDYGSGPNPVLATLLKERYGFDVQIYDLFYANQNQYDHYRYDLITSTEVIEHISDPLSTFKEWHALLKPGGILSVMTLFHSKDLEVFNGWFYIRDTTHLTFYTPKTFEVLAQKTGFKVIWTNHKRQIVLRRGEDA